MNTPILVNDDTPMNLQAHCQTSPNNLETATRCDPLRYKLIYKPHRWPQGFPAGTHGSETLDATVEKNKKPSGRHTKNYGKSPWLMGKSTISMVIFNSYVTNYQGVKKTIVKPWVWVTLTIAKEDSKQQQEIVTSPITEMNRL